MKKLFAILLALVLCFSLCACGGDSGSTETVEETVEDKVEDEVQAYVSSRVLLEYDIFGPPNITCYVAKETENEFKVTGKVTVKDEYGDSYTGNYDTYVEYDPETDTCNVTECYIDTLYKN